MMNQRNRNLDSRFAVKVERINERIGEAENDDAIACFDLRRSTSNKRSQHEYYGREDCTIVRKASAQKKQIEHANSQNLSQLYYPLTHGSSYKYCHANLSDSLAKDSMVYSSPTKTSSKFLDINVSFEENDVTYTSSPRCVMTHHIASLSFEREDGYKYLDTLIFGANEKTKPTTKELDDSFLCGRTAQKDRQHDFDNACEGESCVVDMLSEGMVWKRLLRDLKLVNHYRVNRIEHSTNQCEQLSSVRGSTYLFQTVTKIATISQPSLIPAKHNTLTRNTIGESVGHSLPRNAPGPEIESQLVEQNEIRVVDPRPPCRTILRRFSMNYLYDTLQWNRDRDISSLLPTYSFITYDCCDPAFIASFTVEKTDAKSSYASTGDESDQNNTKRACKDHHQGKRARKLRCLRYLLLLLYQKIGRYTPFHIRY